MANDSTEASWEQQSNVNLWKEAVLRHEPEFVWLRLVPFNGSYLGVMVPTARFSKLLESRTRISTPLAVSHVTRSDHIAEGGSSVGVAYFNPDLSSIYRYPGKGARRVEIMVSLVDQDGMTIPICARSKLANMTATLKREHNLTILIGFEVEVVFMRPIHLENAQHPQFEKVSLNHSWCNLRSEAISILPMIEDIVRKLLELDVAVEKFHAEAAPGQWEFVLGPQTPVEAVDTLLRTRETITTISQEYGLRATLHPRPFEGYPGTGAHTHISANPLGKANVKKVESFFAGIMMHLPSILGFALPLDISYQRIASGIWSGGEYVCWGWENRETPLRRVSETRFEFRLVCGSANPYLAICGILAGGLDGLEKQLPLVGGNCAGEAASLTPEERGRLQITTTLPTTIDESLELLQSNVALINILGEQTVSGYISVTKAWNKELREMDAEERESFIFCNY